MDDSKIIDTFDTYQSTVLVPTHVEVQGMVPDNIGAEVNRKAPPEPSFGPREISHAS